MSKSAGAIAIGIGLLVAVVGRNPDKEERCIERGLPVQFSQDYPRYANPTTRDYGGHERRLELQNTYFSGNLPPDLPIHTTAAEMADAVYKGREASKRVQQLCVNDYHAF